MSVLASWLVELWRDPPPSSDVILALATRPLRCWLVVRVLLRPVGLLLSLAGRPARSASRCLAARRCHTLPAWWFAVPGDKGGQFEPRSQSSCGTGPGRNARHGRRGPHKRLFREGARSCPRKGQNWNHLFNKIVFLMNWRPSQNRPSQTVPSVVLGVVPTTSAGLPVHTQC